MQFTSEYGEIIGVFFFRDLFNWYTVHSPNDQSPNDHSLKDQSRNDKSSEQLKCDHSPNNQSPNAIHPQQRSSFSSGHCISQYGSGSTSIQHFNRIQIRN
jgi:hypothetical protein